MYITYVPGRRRHFQKKFFLNRNNNPKKTAMTKLQFGLTDKWTPTRKNGRYVVARLVFSSRVLVKRLNDRKLLILTVNYKTYVSGRRGHFQKNIYVKKSK